MITHLGSPGHTEPSPRTGFYERPSGLEEQKFQTSEPAPQFTRAAQHSPHDFCSEQAGSHHFLISWIQDGMWSLRTGFVPLLAAKFEESVRCCGRRSCEPGPSSSLPNFGSEVSSAPDSEHGRTCKTIAFTTDILFRQVWRALQLAVWYSMFSTMILKISCNSKLD